MGTVAVGIGNGANPDRACAGVWQQNAKEGPKDSLHFRDKIAGYQGRQIRRVLVSIAVFHGVWRLKWSSMKRSQLVLGTHCKRSLVSASAAAAAVWPGSGKGIAVHIYL
jgi:hypothetical protein